MIIDELKYFLQSTQMLNDKKIRVAGHLWLHHQSSNISLTMSECHYNITQQRMKVHECEKFVTYLLCQAYRQ